MAPTPSYSMTRLSIALILSILSPLSSSFTRSLTPTHPRATAFAKFVPPMPHVSHRQHETVALQVMSDPEDYADEEQLSDEELATTMGEWDDKIARFNTVHLVGRLGSDPEPRHFDDGKVVVNVSIACKRKYHSAERKLRNIASGEEETDWYGLEIWGQTAEFVSKYVDKGARVGVVGSLQMDQWTDKASGEPRSRAKVVVRDFDVLETKAEADLRRSSRGGGRAPSFQQSGDNRSPSFERDDNDGGPTSAGTGAFFD